MVSNEMSFKMTHYATMAQGMMEDVRAFTNDAGTGSGAATQAAIWYSPQLRFYRYGFYIRRSFRGGITPSRSKCQALYF